MAETFLSILLLSYFVHNARRDTESDTVVIQMTLEHVLVQRFKKKMRRKNEL